VTSSRGIVNTIGFAFVVAGVLPLALALGWLTLPSDNLPVPLWAMGCGGAALACAGLSLLVPETLSRPRGLLAALSVTALAILFDWIALARVQGSWRLMLDSLMNPVALRQNAAHDVVVLFAMLLSLLSLWTWLRWIRHMMERDAGTPLQNAGRKRKVQQSAE
jgi:hypothetical protein